MGSRYTCLLGLQGGESGAQLGPQWKSELACEGEVLLGGAKKDKSQREVKKDRARYMEKANRCRQWRGSAGESEGEVIVERAPAAAVSSNNFENHCTVEKTKLQEKLQSVSDLKKLMIINNYSTLIVSSMIKDRIKQASPALRSFFGLGPSILSCRISSPLNSCRETIWQGSEKERLSALSQCQEQQSLPHQMEWIHNWCWFSHCLLGWRRVEQRAGEQPSELFVTERSIWSRFPQLQCFYKGNKQGCLQPRASPSNTQLWTCCPVAFAHMCRLMLTGLKNVSCLLPCLHLNLL